METSTKLRFPNGPPWGTAIVTAFGLLIILDYWSAEENIPAPKYGGRSPPRLFRQKNIHQNAILRLNSIIAQIALVTLFASVRNTSLDEDFSSRKMLALDLNLASF